MKHKNMDGKYIDIPDCLRDKTNLIIELRERLNCINDLLDSGYDPENLDYDLQAVNQAHRVASGGPIPRKTKIGNDHDE